MVGRKIETEFVAIFRYPAAAWLVVSLLSFADMPKHGECMCVDVRC